MKETKVNIYTRIRSNNRIDQRNAGAAMSPTSAVFATAGLKA